jgi:CoA:oxalate CoA-transferase
VGRVLEGVRVLDLTRVVAGPFATAILADLGADVVKIERPGTGDDYRYGPSPRGETSLSFQNTNRGKRSVTLDVRQPEGRDLLLRLCDGADVLVENFRAGTMDGWGLGPDVLQERNPRLVVGSLSGYGRTGPRAGGASYDIVAQASGGFLAMTGFEDVPVRGGGALADFVGGLYLAIGVVAGVLERDRTGRARALDLSNQDCMFAVTDSAASIFHGIGERYGRVGNQHPFTAPYDCYPTRDGYMVLGVASNKLFRELMTAIGREELASDERYRSHRSRAARRVEINAVVAGWMAERSCDEVDRVLGPKGADVPCTRVISPEEAIDDPQLLAREMVERHPHPSLGEVLFHGSPLHFEGAAARERALAPDLGEANDEVYGGLGLSGEERTALAEKGVI